MAIDAVDIDYNTRDVAGVIDNVKNNINNIVGDVLGEPGVQYSVGANFAGMDSANLATFDNALTTYKDSVADIIDTFNPDAEMDEALKGDVAEAFRAFLQAMKELLKKYLDIIDIEKREVDEANQRFLEAAGKIATSSTSDTEGIRAQAGGLQID